MRRGRDGAALQLALRIVAPPTPVKMSPDWMRPLKAADPPGASLRRARDCRARVQWGCCDKGCYLLTIRAPSERRFRPRPTPYSCEGSTCDAPLEVAAAAMRGEREQHPKKQSVARCILVEELTLTRRIFPSCSKQQPSPPPPGRHTPSPSASSRRAAAGSQPNNRHVACFVTFSR